MKYLRLLLSIFLLSMALSRVGWSRPIIMPDQPVLTLDDLGLYEAGYALRPDVVDKSDGVTFRVFVAGEKRLDVSRVNADWQPFTVDLTPWSGKTATLRFETDPGPHDESSFDFALWGGRQVVLTGFTSLVKSRPAPPPLDLRRLVSRQNGSVVPLSGFAGKTDIRVAAGQAVLRYRGTEGTLEFHWKPNGDALLGQLTLRAAMAGDTPVTARWPGRRVWIGQAQRH